VIEVPVRRLREDAVIPSQAYSGDAGLDLSACGRHELGPGERAVVPTGVAVAIPEGHGGFVLPRSGLAARSGITLVEPGMRVAQLVVLPVPAVDLVELEELPATERGSRGFGSSRA
jgi:dUTP pyrophosphatase